MKLNNVLQFFEKEFDAGNKETVIQLAKHMNDVCNQQNEKIKELEEKIHLLNEQSQNNYEKYINELKENQQLTDKDKEQNQKAIEQLQELLEKTQTLNIMVKSEHYVNEKRADVVFKDIIEQKINELKGDVNEKEN